MAKRTPPPKSRVPADKVRVIIHPDTGRTDPPAHVGIYGGQFTDAGYRSGTGGFGFWSPVVAQKN